jgi:hypothetical protein
MVGSLRSLIKEILRHRRNHMMSILNLQAIKKIIKINHLYKNLKRSKKGLQRNIKTCGNVSSVRWSVNLTRNVPAGIVLLTLMILKNILSKSRYLNQQQRWVE